MRVQGTVFLAAAMVVWIAAAQNHGIATPATSSVGDREEIIRLERTSWEAVKHKDKATLSGLLAEGYFDFGSDGRYDAKKSLSTGWMDGDTLKDFSWTELQVNFLDDHTALITYRGKYHGMESGKESSGEAYYSSLYQKQKGKWLVVFTQDSNLRCAGM